MAALNALADSLLAAIRELEATMRGELTREQLEVVRKLVDEDRGGLVYELMGGWPGL